MTFTVSRIRNKGFNKYLYNILSPSPSLSLSGHLPEATNTGRCKDAADIIIFSVNLTMWLNFYDYKEEAVRITE
jgi:hypothetical protein